MSDRCSPPTEIRAPSDAGSGIAKFPNGTFAFIDGVLAFNKDTDLALLQISAKGLPAVQLGDARQVKVGDRVIAIGSPLALEATVSDGIISARRELDGVEILQTTAPISPGSSGGALMNGKGEVIGVTSLTSRKGQLVNFAYPVEYVKDLLSEKQWRPFSSLRAGHKPYPPTDARPSQEFTPTLWTNLLTGQDYRVRIDGEYLYTEWVPSGVLLQYKNSGAFEICEFRREEDTWVGTCRSRWPLTCSGWAGDYLNWCTFDYRETLRLVSPRRIEGQGEWPDLKEDFNCRKCQAKRVIRRDFALIPKN